MTIKTCENVTKYKNGIDTIWNKWYIWVTKAQDMKQKHKDADAEWS